MKIKINGFDVECTVEEGLELMRVAKMSKQSWAVSMPMPVPEAKTVETAQKQELPATLPEKKKPVRIYQPSKEALYTLYFFLSDLIDKTKKMGKQKSTVYIKDHAEGRYQKWSGVLNSLESVVAQYGMTKDEVIIRTVTYQNVEGKRSSVAWYEAGPLAEKAMQKIKYDYENYVEKADK